MVEAMGFGERTLPARVGAALVRVRYARARSCPNSQMRALAARSACRNSTALVARSIGTPASRSISESPSIMTLGSPTVARFADEPIAHRERLAQPLIGQDGRRDRTRD